MRRERGLDVLMAMTAALIAVLTGFTFATISCGCKRSACCARPLRPRRLPTTSNSGLSLNRCRMTCASAGQPTSSIRILRTPTPLPGAPDSSRAHVENFGDYRIVRQTRPLENRAGSLGWGLSRTRVAGDSRGAAAVRLPSRLRYSYERRLTTSIHGASAGGEASTSRCMWSHSEWILCDISG